MYLLLGFLRFSVIFFATAKYLQTNVNWFKDFPKNVLEAFGLQKSSFILVNILFCGLKASKTFFGKFVNQLTVVWKYLAIAKKTQKISKILGGDTFCVFYFRFFNAIFFLWNEIWHFFLSCKCDYSNLIWALM